jgi:hydroxymethylglutaryl-CoA reductase
MGTSDVKDRFKGFSKLTRAERFERLVDMGALSIDDVKFLSNGGLKDMDLAEKFIENVIGYFQIPLGVATNFCIDGEDLAIPMAVEETSIIAAASKTAKWIRESGGTITTDTLGELIIGQIQIARVSNFALFASRIETQKEEFIEMANRDVAQGLVDRGGGVMDIQVRRVPRGDGGDMAVIHVLADPCDAMGANIMNQVCEYLKGPVQEVTGETVTMCILSNLVDTKLTRARVTMKIDEQTGRAIEEASLFAQQDPYRAATNNKGVLNGIDPILVATGNDWRAVEAGVHSYASRDGQYRSITKWIYRNGELHGEIVAPIVVGTVGGVTRLHPTAKMCLTMLGVENASRLSGICAAVGLVQNLGALRALTTVGIIEGHMKLHVKNLTLGAGASEREAPFVQKRLEEILMLRKRISLNNAIEVLRELRASNGVL